MITSWLPQFLRIVCKDKRTSVRFCKMREIYPRAIPSPLRNIDVQFPLEENYSPLCKSAANFPIVLTITSIMGTVDPIASWHPVIQTKEAAIWFRGGTAEISCREWPGVRPCERTCDGEGRQGAEEKGWRKREILKGSRRRHCSGCDSRYETRM